MMQTFRAVVVPVVAVEARHTLVVAVVVAGQEILSFEELVPVVGKQAVDGLLQQEEQVVAVADSPLQVLAVELDGVVVEVRGDPLQAVVVEDCTLLLAVLASAPVWARVVAVRSLLLVVVDEEQAPLQAVGYVAAVVGVAMVCPSPADLEQVVVDCNLWLVVWVQDGLLLAVAEEED